VRHTEFLAEIWADELERHDATPVRRFKLRCSPICIAIAIALFAAAQAASAGVCQVTASPITFGIFDAFAARNTVSVGTVSYICTGRLPAGLRIEMLPGARGKVYPRVMIGPRAKRLAYYLALDPGGNLIWGDGTRGSQVFFDPSPPPGQTVRIRVYARIIPRRRIPAVGLYSDHVKMLARF
jgi:spore coat protein U-like protein